jgi:hypothetical protein
MSADSVVLGACCVLCCVPPDRVPNSIPAPEHELRPSLRPGWRQGEQFGRVSAGLTSVRSGLSLPRWWQRTRNWSSFRCGNSENYCPPGHLAPDDPTRSRSTSCPNGISIAVTRQSAEPFAPIDLTSGGKDSRINRPIRWGERQR